MPQWMLQDVSFGQFYHYQVMPKHRSHLWDRLSVIAGVQCSQVQCCDFDALHPFKHSVEEVAICGTLGNLRFAGSGLRLVRV